MTQWFENGNRKLRKLARNPNRFFFDMFKKRLQGTTAARDTIGLDEPLPRDCITSVEKKYDELVALLSDSTLTVQPIGVEHPNVRRLAIKSGDMSYALEVICSADFGKYRPVVRVKGERKLYEVSFTDDRFEYRNPVIELDPWTVSGPYVQSPNVNKFTSAVGVMDIHKTVCSPGPLHLAGETDTQPGLEEVLGLTHAFLGCFDQPVDVVYTWVDDCDPEWQKRKKAYLRSRGQDATEDAASEARFRNRGELRYSLRSIAAFLPEVRNIFIVTDSQVPAWLDTSHPKIRMVSHEDIFPNADHLPTFNSHAIEANLHRIEGLSEHFLYFNDDVLLMNPCVMLDFFHPNGIGKSFFESVGNIYGAENAEYAAFKNAALRGAKLLLEKYGKTAHTYHEHVVHALRKSVIEGMWNDFPNELEATSAAHLRGDSDLSPLSFFYHYYALANCATVPAEIKNVYVPLRRNCEKLFQDLRGDFDTKVVCINDLPATSINEGIAATTFLNFMWPVAVEWELDK